MAPKSSQADKKTPVSTGERKSARLAGTPAPAPEPKAPSKRAASAPKSGPASKKTKTAESASKDGPKSKTTASKKETKAAEEEKKEEAPKSAKADTGGKGAIKLGDKLPSITVQDNEEKEVDVSKLAEGGKGVIIFLYPKADTPGCTNQACGYRDAHDELAQLGYDVYGLSKDKPAAQQKWINKKSLNYKLLCDPESKLIKKLGAFVQPNNTKRSHFIFEKGTGKLIDLQLGVKPADDPTNCVKFIKAHQK